MTIIIINTCNNEVPHFSTAMHWILSPELKPAATYSDLIIEDLMMCEEYISSKNQIHWLRKKLLVTPQKIQNVLEATKGQRTNHLWAALRKHRFTASNFHKILTAIRINRYDHFHFGFFHSLAHFTGIHYHLIRVHHLPMSQEQVSTF